MRVVEKKRLEKRVKALKARPMVSFINPGKGLEPTAFLDTTATVVKAIRGGGLATY